MSLLNAKSCFHVRSWVSAPHSIFYSAVRTRNTFAITGFCLAAMMLLLSACGTQQLTKQPARPYALATISPTPGALVSLHVTVRQTAGKVAQRNVALTAWITINNYTDHPISLYGTCQQEAIIASLAPQGANGAPIELAGSPNCPLMTGADLQPAIDAHHAHTYTRTYDLFGFASGWQAGVYTFIVVAPTWHQDTAAGLGGSATEQTTVTLT